MLQIPVLNEETQHSYFEFAVYDDPYLEHKVTTKDYNMKDYDSDDVKASLPQKLKNKKFPPKVFNKHLFPNHNLSDYKQGIVVFNNISKQGDQLISPTPE